jgi:hypothetical protein
LGGGDAVSVQEVRRKTHRGRKEEGGETVRTGGESRFLMYKSVHFHRKEHLRDCTRN